MNPVRERRGRSRASGVAEAAFLAVVLLGCGRTSLDDPMTGAGLAVAEVADASRAGEAAGGGAHATGGNTVVADSSLSSAGNGSAGTATQTAGVTISGGLTGTAGMASIGGIRTGGSPGGATSAGGAGGIGGRIFGGSMSGGAGRVFGGSMSGGAGRVFGGSMSTGGRTRITGGSSGGFATGGSGGRSYSGGTTTAGGAGGTWRTTTTGGTGGLGGATSSGKTSSGGTGAGGGSGGTGGGKPSLMLQPLIAAFCSAAKSCCPRQGYPLSDLSTCEAKFLSRLDSFPLVEKGTVAIDPNALAACESAYKIATDNCTITPVKAACKGVFLGLQSEGQPCGGSSPFGATECKPVNRSATCYRPNGASDPASAGTCITLPHGKSGDACSSSCPKGKTCIVDMMGGSAPFPVTCFEEDGVYCAASANPNVCKPVPKIGETCSWGMNSCGSGSYCGYSAPGSNVCLSASKLGESCLDTACADGLDCGDSLKCEEQLFASDSICKGYPSTP